MPRPLLEIWRDLNRDRKPSSLLEQAIAIARKPPSPMQQMLARIDREMSSPMARIVRELSSPELRERLRRMQEMRKACGVAEQVLPRPVSSVQPDERAQPGKRKSAKPAGRPHRFTPKQIEDGIHIVRGKPGISLDAAWETLKAAGIKGSKSTVYRFIFKPARS